VLFERTAEQAEDPLALVRRYLGDADIVLVEGYKKAPLPKIEVHRKRKHQEPLFDPASGDAAQWVAMVTDDEQLRVSIPTFRFTDTGWLVTLAQLAWDRAVVVG
jgi:molybdopterin-guanine dinucleotide biosynthesis protein B